MIPELEQRIATLERLQHMQKSHNLILACGLENLMASMQEFLADLSRARTIYSEAPKEDIPAPEDPPTEESPA